MTASPTDENEDPDPRDGENPEPHKGRVIAKRVLSLVLTAVIAWMAWGQQNDAAPTNKAEAAIFVLITVVRAML